MEIIEIPEEHALLDLSTVEIRALWKAFTLVADGMDRRTVIDTFEITPEYARALSDKLIDALEFAQRNVHEG
jgi:hypothetical protein